MGVEDLWSIPHEYQKLVDPQAQLALDGEVAKYKSYTVVIDMTQQIASERVLEVIGFLGKLAMRCCGDQHEQVFEKLLSFLNESYSVKTKALKIIADAVTPGSALIALERIVAAIGLQDGNVTWNSVTWMQATCAMAHIIHKVAKEDDLVFKQVKQFFSNLTNSIRAHVIMALCEFTKTDGVAISAFLELACEFVTTCKYLPVKVDGIVQAIAKVARKGDHHVVTAVAAVLKLRGQFVLNIDDHPHNFEKYKNGLQALLMVADKGHACATQAVADLFQLHRCIALGCDRLHLRRRELLMLDLHCLLKLAQSDDEVMVAAFQDALHDCDSEVTAFAKHMVQAEMVAIAPNVGVLVEDAVFKISVRVLEFASPVIRRMLILMRQASMTSLDLSGWSKDEFVVFKDIIEDAFQTYRDTTCVDFGVKVDATNVDFLLEWFDHFEVHESGRHACEQTLIEMPIMPPEASERLRQVDRFALSERQRERCKLAIVRYQIEVALAAVPPGSIIHRSAMKSAGQAPISGKKLRSQKKARMTQHRLSDRLVARASKYAGPKGLPLDGIDILP